MGLRTMGLQKMGLPKLALPKLALQCLVIGLCAGCGLAWLPQAEAAFKPSGAVTIARALPDGAEVAAGTFKLRVTLLSDNVVRLQYAPQGTFSTHASFAVVPNAYAERPHFEFQSGAKDVTLQTAALRVRIDRASMRVTVEDLKGNPILQDQPGLTPAWNGKEFRVWKTMPKDEHYFGLGDKSGPLDHRDQSYSMWNTDAYGWQESTDPLYKSIPFLMGVRNGSAWGLFLDNTYRSSWDLGKANKDYFSFGSEDGPLDYYVFYGPEPKHVVQQYTALTGRTPLPPLFAMAYQQSRYSYFPESRVREIAKGYRDRKIPLDALYLDIDYQMGNRPFTIDTNGFPNFNGLVKDLAADGIKTITILDLHVKHEAGYAPYDSGHAGDHFIKAADGKEYVGTVWPGDSVFPDFTQASARTWWGGLYADFKNRGIRGFWNDMNEPAVFNPTKTMPLDNIHRVTEATGERKTDHREIHNVLGMENDRATYEGLLKLRPNERPFVLTRAAYAGTQRYAATWTGDNTASWNHMKLSVPQVLNLGVSGYAMTGVDVGGYAGNPPPDLLTRWMELGAFYPIYRNHAEKGSRDREPWVDGPEHEAIRKKFIELRYQLLPYTYTQMEETSRTGVPLMRPMFMEFPNDPTQAIEEKEFMFGQSLLVAPALTESVRGYALNLPKGQWYDYWTGEAVEGGAPDLTPGQPGEPRTVTPALGEMPLFVRAGAIIPQQPVIQHVEQKPDGPLELRVYPGPNCEGSLYLDDGNTFGYQHGEYFRQGFSCGSLSSPNGRTQVDAITVNLAPPEGLFHPGISEIRVTIFGISGSRVPQTVRFNGQAGNKLQFDAAHHSVSTTLPWIASGGKVEFLYKAE